jgi:hypothetical protein
MIRSGAVPVRLAARTPVDASTVSVYGVFDADVRDALVCPAPPVSV